MTPQTLSLGSLVSNEPCAQETRSPRQRHGNERPAHVSLTSRRLALTGVSVSRRRASSAQISSSSVVGADAQGTVFRCSESHIAVRRRGPASCCSRPRSHDNQDQKFSASPPPHTHTHSGQRINPGVDTGPSRHHHCGCPCAALVAAQGIRREGPGGMHQPTHTLPLVSKPQRPRGLSDPDTGGHSLTALLGRFPAPPATHHGAGSAWAAGGRRAPEADRWARRHTASDVQDVFPGQGRLPSPWTWCRPPCPLLSTGTSWPLPQVGITVRPVGPSEVVEPGRRRHRDRRSGQKAGHGISSSATISGVGRGSKEGKRAQAAARHSLGANGVHGQGMMEGARGRRWQGHHGPDGASQRVRGRDQSRHSRPRPLRVPGLSSHTRCGRHISAPPPWGRHRPHCPRQTLQEPVGREGRRARLTEHGRNPSSPTGESLPSSPSFCPTQLSLGPSPHPTVPPPGAHPRGRPQHPHPTPMPRPCPGRRRRLLFCIYVSRKALPWRHSAKCR